MEHPPTPTWLRAQGENKGGSLKNGLTKKSAMPNDHQDSEERRQKTVLRMEIGRRKEGTGQNQEAGNFLEKRKGDVSLVDVTADGDRNFLEKNFQIQIRNQRNKEDTDRHESVGTLDRKEKEG